MDAWRPAPTWTPLATVDLGVAQPPASPAKCGPIAPPPAFFTEKTVGDVFSQIQSPEQATRILALQVRDWSDYQDVERDGVRYRYTMTYLSPDVVQAALIKLAVERGFSSGELRKISERVNSQLGQSSELAFLLTAAMAGEEKTRANQSAGSQYAGCQYIGRRNVANAVGSLTRCRAEYFRTSAVCAHHVPAVQRASRREVCGHHRLRPGHFYHDSRLGYSEWIPVRHNSVVYQPLTARWSHRRSHTDSRTLANVHASANVYA